jgi:hypothetical protein
VACNRPAGETKSQDKLVEALSGASADAGSIPAASTSGFKPKMDRDNRYIPRVIEHAESRVRRIRGRRFDFSPRQALYYNDHPDAIIEDFDRSEYGTVLREIERHVVQWERQQTPEQAEWVAEARRRKHLSTGAAAAAIVQALRS